MLSNKNAKTAIKVLALLLAAAISLFFLTPWLPESRFVQDSVASVEKSNQTILQFSAATLSTSLAISALPDDFATPLASSLSDMNIYFIVILVILFLEELLIQYGIPLAFAILIPCACVSWALSILSGKQLLKGFALRLCSLALALAFVVPCSTHLTNYVASDLNTYVDATISETESGADKLNQAMDGSADEKTIFEKLSDLFQTAMTGISDLLQYFQDNIRRCMQSIAILILTNAIMPLLTFFVLKWILRETFNIVIPAIPVKALPQLHNKEAKHDEGKESKELATGGKQ